MPQQQNQHVADMVSPAKEEGEDPDFPTAPFAPRCVRLYIRPQGV